MKKISDSRVLIVDDTKANLDILVEGMKNDYKLSLALDGEMALQIATRTPPDLVLLDIMMPGIDGYEVCRRLRQIPEMAEMPIVFLSALGEIENKTRGFEAGANDYLTKPFEMLEVKARVRSLLKAKAYTQAMQEQLSGELRVAHDIQMGMVPQDFGDIERDYGVELGAMLKPARQVGGDLYGVCGLEGGKVILFLGDVSGKGIPAALFMVRAVSLARLLARGTPDPASILSQLNDALAADNPSCMFVTFLCAILDTTTGRLVMANGGQCLPVLVGPDSSPRWATEDLGLALGFEPGIEFRNIEVTMRPGDTLLLYTDGVTEAFNPHNEWYGKDRLLSFAKTLANKPAKRVIEGLFNEVKAFSDGAPQSDDIAIMALRFGMGTLRDGGVTLSAGNGDHLPDVGTRTPLPTTLTLSATPKDVIAAVNAVREFGRHHQFDDKVLFGITLAVEECCNNIMRHAYQFDVRRTFEMRVLKDDTALVVELADDGPAFDPTRAPDVNVDAESDSPTGGLGIHFARHYADEMHYRRAGFRNILRLIKKHVPSPQPTHTNEP